MFSPQNSNVYHVTSPDAPPATTSTLPPPLPVKSRDARPQEPLSPTLRRPGDAPSGSPPSLTRSSTARVSFREPISSCWSLDENKDGKEEELQEVNGNQQDEDEEEGSLGRMQKGIPPQMDLLGEEELRSIESILICLIYCCRQKYEPYTSINHHDSSSFIPSSTQMDSLTARKGCSEVGTGAVSPRTRFFTREQRGATGARSPPGLGWTPWNKGKKTGIRRNPTTPHVLRSKPARTNTKTPVPPVPHHQIRRKKVISWDNPYRCPLSSENISLRRAERRSRGGRCSEIGG